jgi:hypothetical protein
MSESERTVIQPTHNRDSGLVDKVHSAAHPLNRQALARLGGEKQLVIDEEEEHTKKHYKFPYGDFTRVHRCAVLSAESRAGQYKHFDIENAAAHLHGMIDNSKRPASAKAKTRAHGQRSSARS